MAAPGTAKLAKLTRPRLHDVLARERLFALLDQCRKRPVTWVVGPPGAGKTALVASYLEVRSLLYYHAYLAREPQSRWLMKAAPE